MELDVRDWLIILGTLVAAGFVLDAYRRVRAHQREQLRLSAKARSEDDELSNPELPEGRARVVSGQVAARNKAVPSYERGEDSGRDRDEDEQDEPVPVLMDSVGEPSDLAAQDLEDRHEEPPVENDADSVDDDGIGSVRVKRAQQPHGETEPRETGQRETERKEGAGRSSRQPEEIIVLHVVAPAEKSTEKKDALIRGPELLQILLACDVRYGAMQIFHRHEQAGGEGPEQFSVANMVAPGTFDLDAMDDFTTPGVSFFMKLPGPKEAIRAFDAMVETAQCLVKNLGCELRDEAHSVVTTQTLQHLRQRIRDFERRQLTLV